MTIENNEIIAEFVQESREHLEGLENDLLAIEAGGDQVDTELINKVFRSIHSIKGAAGFLGLNTINELAHSLENILNLMRGGELLPSRAIVDALLRASDALYGLIVNIETSNDADVSEHIANLQRALEGGTSDEVRESMAREIVVGDPQGVTFAISDQLLATQKAVGNQLFVVTCDLLRDVDEKGQSPISFVKSLLQYGELLESRLDSDPWGGLEAELPDTIPFLALFGTVLEESAMVAEALELPADQVQGPLTLGEPSEASADVKSARSQGDEPADRSESTSTSEAPETVAAAGGSSASPVATRAPAPSPAGEPAPASSSSAETQVETSIRVSVSVLDRLMNLAGELVLGRNRLLQSVNTEGHGGIESIAAELDQVTSELQESIMQTRMQPIGTVFGRFPRVVRDLSNKLGKQCELVIEGKDVELDKSIIEGIGDPLTHLVRNAVDHGIESPEVRRQAGKKPAGTITLRAFHQAGKVNLCIEDDGAGIDPAKLRDKAVAKGLLTAEQARELGDREAVRLIFHPGFSTAEQVTDVSGRGVGMDVVRTNIERLGGTVDIESKVGAGSTIGVKLPLTLAIIPSLVVRCGSHRFALPQVNISELVRIRGAEVATRIERVKDAEVLRLRGHLLPLVRLSRALGLVAYFRDPKTGLLREDRRGRMADRRDGELGANQAVAPDAEPQNVKPQNATSKDVKSQDAISGDSDADRRDSSDRRRNRRASALNVIVVESGHLRYGLVVDDLHDSEEIVVKPLGRHMKDVSCLAGATILGDGRVAMILDVAGIAAHCELRMPEGFDGDRHEGAAARVADDMQSLLLFTNGPSEHFAVPMGLIARIERIRVEQIDSVGGQAVLQYRGTSLPLIRLENHIKAGPGPELRQVYVIVYRLSQRGQEVGLVAPHLEDIRRVQAELDTVTFREPGVLGSLVIDEKTTRMIDLYELARRCHPEWFTAKTPGRGGRVAEAPPRILFAEDSSFFRNQLESFLAGEGYEVVACADGAEAWDTLREDETPFDAVLTDIEMPNLDGYGLTERIKADERFATLPVIAVTSLAAREEVERGQRAGIDEYLIKLDRDQLIEVMGRHVGKPRPAAAT